MKKLILLLSTLILCAQAALAQESEWSGSGFALNGRYIVTNNHVVDGATTLKVRGINGDFVKKYNAVVVATDATHDLAIIKITDSSFMGFGDIPYRLQPDIAEVGEEVFVLGYPHISAMGEEIKLTTGVISSRSGFKGEVSAYQISAPIQPGNSGGPLFDSKGNLIGVVNAIIANAQNVGYAIKSPYLKLFIQNNINTNIIPTKGTLSGMTLAEKVRAIRPFVFIIHASTNGAANRSRTQSRSGHDGSLLKSRIGDIVTVNGITGIVLHIDSSGHGLLMSIKQTKQNWSGAKSWCKSLGSGWHLPSVEELEILYNRKSVINPILKRKGYAALDVMYWTNSEYDSDYARYANISTGYTYVNYKSAYSSVRAMYLF